MKSKISFKGHFCNRRTRDLIKTRETETEGKSEEKKICGVLGGFKLEAVCRQTPKVSRFGNLEVTGLKSHSHQAVAAMLTAGTLKGVVKISFYKHLLRDRAPAMPVVFMPHYQKAFFFF